MYNTSKNASDREEKQGFPLLARCYRKEEKGERENRCVWVDRRVGGEGAPRPADPELPRGKKSKSQSRVVWTSAIAREGKENKGVWRFS